MNLRSAFKGVEWAEEQANRLVDLEHRLHFAVQPDPQGYGHAVWCARDFVAGSPFLLLLGDHLYLSAEQRRCARQVIDLAAEENCAVSAVQATREHLIHQYGTLTGRRLAQRPDVYTIDEIIEKPNPTLAELRLQVARPASGALPLLLWHARPHARPSSNCSIDSSRTTSVNWVRSSSRRPSTPWPAARSIWPSRPAGRGSTWGSSSASSRPRSPWRWLASTASRSSPFCVESLTRLEQTASR